jgi:hypothetical protein
MVDEVLRVELLDAILPVVPGIAFPSVRDLMIKIQAFIKQAVTGQ